MMNIRMIHAGPRESAGAGFVLDAESLERLVAANAPVFYLHPDDAFMPTPVEWFMARSDLMLLEVGLVA